MLRTGLVLFSLALILAGCSGYEYRSKILPGQGGDHHGDDQKMRTCKAQFTSGFCASFAWQKAPKDGEGSFNFRTLKPDRTGPGKEIEFDGTLAVEIWMPSKNHGSSIVTVKRVGFGSYRATGLIFTEPGGWEIRIQVKDAQSKVVDQAVIAVNI